MEMWEKGVGDVKAVARGSPSQLLPGTLKLRSLSPAGSFSLCLVTLGLGRALKQDMKLQGQAGHLCHLLPREAGTSPAGLAARGLHHIGGRALLGGGHSLFPQRPRLLSLI